MFLVNDDVLTGLMIPLGHYYLKYVVFLNKLKVNTLKQVFLANKVVLIHHPVLLSSILRTEILSV